MGASQVEPFIPMLIGHSLYQRLLQVHTPRRCVVHQSHLLIAVTPTLSVNIYLISSPHEKASKPHRTRYVIN